MVKKSISSILIGTAITVAALAGVVTTIKKTVIDLTEEKEDMTEENHEKAMRKCIVR